MLNGIFFFFFFFFCAVFKKKRKRPIYKASVMINFSFFHFSITKSVYHISKIVFSFIKSQYYTEMRKKWHLPLNLNLKFFYKISLQGDLFIKAKWIRQTFFFVNCKLRELHDYAIFTIINCFALVESSHQGLFCKKAALKYPIKFRVKHLCQNFAWKKWHLF